MYENLKKLKKLHPVKTPAILLGMAGSLLVAMPAAALRMAGFVSWMIANSLWIHEGLKTHDFYIAGLFAFYFLTSGLGVLNLN